MPSCRKNRRGGRQRKKNCAFTKEHQGLTSWGHVPFHIPSLIFYTTMPKRNSWPVHSLFRLGNLLDDPFFWWVTPECFPKKSSIFFYLRMHRWNHRCMFYQPPWTSWWLGVLRNPCWPSILERDICSRIHRSQYEGNWIDFWRFFFQWKIHHLGNL